MTAQLEIFRKRLRGSDANKKDKMKFKELASLSLSLLAFLISAITFYYNTIRQIDELRILIDDPPYLTLLGGGHGEEIVVGPILSAFFINSGARTISILGFSVMLLEHDWEMNSAECLHGRKMEVDVEPFVLKEREARRVRMVLTPGGNGGRLQEPGWSRLVAGGAGRMTMRSPKLGQPVLWNFPGLIE